MTETERIAELIALRAKTADIEAKIESQVARLTADNGKLTAEVTRLKEELRPWEMLREMVERHALLRPDWNSDDKFRQVAEEYCELRDDVLTKTAWQAAQPGWIEAQYNEWRERFPQEGE